MNFRIGIEGYMEIYCHKCKQIISPCDLKDNNDSLYCLFCNTHLGYIWDLPEWAKHYVIK